MWIKQDVLRWYPTISCDWRWPAWLRLWYYAGRIT